MLLGRRWIGGSVRVSSFQGFEVVIYGFGDGAKGRLAQKGCSSSTNVIMIGLDHWMGHMND